MSLVKSRGKCFNFVSQINGTLHYFRSTSPVFLEAMLGDSLLTMWHHGKKVIYHHPQAEKLGCTYVPNLLMMFPVAQETNNFFFPKLKLSFVTAQVLVSCWILFACFGVFVHLKIVESDQNKFSKCFENKQHLYFLIELRSLTFWSQLRQKTDKNQGGNLQDIKLFPLLV